MRKNLSLFLLTISIIGNIFLYFQWQTKNADNETVTQKDFPYLSKRIFAENQNNILINFIPLRQNLRSYVGKQKGKVGVYFEYLPSGTSIGVNDKEEIRLTSLSKVPIAMSIFKKIERGKMSLNDNLVIKKENLNQRFGTLWERGEGANLSVEELIRLTLVDSDNTAYYVLFDQLTVQEVNEVYKNLDISIDLKEKEGEIYPIVSPKNYSSIFRSLYLSSFLSQKNSNQILNILTKTPFNDKIDAGIPGNIKVAHKIGVFETLNPSQDVFIDCGIIYIPNRPYVLCIFVKDTNEQAQKHMSYISKMVYEYIGTINGGKK